MNTNNNALKNIGNNLKSKNSNSMSQEQKQEKLQMLQFSMPIYPVSPSKYNTWITLQDVVSKSGLTLKDAADLLQNHDYLIGKEWCEEFLKYGIVFPLPEYEGVTAEFGVPRYFNEILVSPHGQEWLEEFFEVAEMMPNPQI